MTDYTITAANVLGLYLWDKLQTELEWSEDDYGGIVPVVPVQQQPELNATTKPFVVFGTAFDAISPMWQLQSETVGFTVFSQKVSDINKVTNLIVFDLKGFDEAAAKINAFVDTLDPAHPAKEFDFKTVRLVGASGAQPSMQEGGRHDGSIALKVTYAHYGSSGVESRG